MAPLSSDGQFAGNHFSPARRQFGDVPAPALHRSDDVKLQQHPLTLSNMLVHDPVRYIAASNIINYIRSINLFCIRILAAGATITPSAGKLKTIAQQLTNGASK